MCFPGAFSTSPSLAHAVGSDFGTRVVLPLLHLLTEDRRNWIVGCSKNHANDAFGGTGHTEHSSRLVLMVLVTNIVLLQELHETIILLFSNVLQIVAQLKASKHLVEHLHATA